MKVRDSGMPVEKTWESFFCQEKALSLFGLGKGTGDVVEFGCGYGTFTLAAARLVSGTVHALDIEPEMIRLVEDKCRQEGVGNVHTELRDFVTNGTGHSDATVDATLLFNILHHEQPVQLLSEAFRILKPGGKCAVIHWNFDPTTPRGPAMEIRPRPQQCIAWAKKAGFTFSPQDHFDLKPYHYGLLFQKVA
jgi:ubiquinone/menaquinone biosynthesis C-methylase UbiE